MKTMIDLNYIESVSNKDGVITQIRGNNETIKIFINGGFAIKTKKEKSTRLLIRLGQVSGLLVGIYYGKEILEKPLGMMASWVCALLNF